MAKAGKRYFSQRPNTSKGANKGAVTKNKSTSSRKSFSKSPKQAKK